MVSCTASKAGLTGARCCCGLLPAVTEDPSSLSCVDAVGDVKTGTLYALSFLLESRKSHLAHQFLSGCGVTQASESWALEATVQLCPPRPFASLVQLVQDTALPTLRHRFESGTVHQIFFCFCSSTGRARRFERRGCGFESCQEFHSRVRK